MSGTGRPSEYDESFIDNVDAYLAERQDSGTTVQLPTLEGFAHYIGFNKTTLYEWEKAHEAFSNALDRIRLEQRERLMNKGLSGAYNPTIAKLILSSNHGMAERTESKNTTTIDQSKVEDKADDILRDD